MQKLVNFASASSLMKGIKQSFMRFIPRILEQLKGLPKSTQIAVIHLLYFAFFTTMVSSVTAMICWAVFHR